MVCGGTCQGGGFCKRRTGEGRCYQHLYEDLSGPRPGDRSLSGSPRSIIELSPMMGDMEYPDLMGGTPAKELKFSRTRFSEGLTPQKKVAKSQRKVQSAKKPKPKAKRPNWA